jgi:putative methionine-R-sulfoxide reductase with GAF domain
VNCATEFAMFFALTPELGILTGYGQESYWMNFKTGQIKKIFPSDYGINTPSKKIQITGCMPLGNERFLMATRFGLYEYDLLKDRFTPKKIYVEGRPYELSNLIQRLNTGSNGIIWANTSTHLLAIQETSNSLGLIRNPHLDGAQRWDNRIYGMVHDDQSNIWMTDLGGFKKLSLKTGEITMFPNREGATDRLSHPILRGIQWNGKYVVLGPVDGGVWLYEPRTGRYQRPQYAADSVRNALESEYIDYIGKMRNGDLLVCGRFFPYRIKAGTIKAEILEFPHNKDNMDFAMQDAQGRIWLGTHISLICLDSQYRFLFRYTFPEGAAVNTIFQHQKDTFFIGTRFGLHRLTLMEKSFVVSSLNTPLDGHGISGIFLDSLKRYWISSSYGLLMSDYWMRQFRLFDFSDNIQSKLFYNGAMSYHKPSGILFFSGSNGINYCVPERVDLAHAPLQVLLQSIQINDGDSVLYRLRQDQDIDFRHNTLTFEVVAPYYYNAARVQYRCRFGNKDTEWAYHGVNPSIRFGDLPPGDYLLEVEASTDGQVWTAAPAFRFRVAPPFWRTWWFMSLGLMGVLGLIWAWVHFREGRLRLQQAQQLELERVNTLNLQYQLKTEQVVNYFAHALSNQHTVDELLWSVTRECIAHLDWEDCVIYMLDDTQQILLQKAAWGEKSDGVATEVLNPIAIPMGKGIVGHVAQSGQPELVSDTAADNRYIVDDRMRGSELAVPIFLEGKVIGVIDSEHSQVAFYTTWHLQILTAIAALCGNRIALIGLSQAQTATQRQLKEKETRLLEAEKNAAQVRLMALTNQLNPHFLFNALASLNSLIADNKTLAADFLGHLSKVYRYVLQHREEESVPLEHELNFVKNYVQLQKTRFGDGLEVAFDVPESLLHHKIVPVTLQILLENAIKHNTTAPENPLYIRVLAEGGYLVVHNKLQLKSFVPTSNRSGLQQLSALYTFLDARPILVEQTDNYFKIKLPLL